MGRPVLATILIPLCWHACSAHVITLGGYSNPAVLLVLPEAGATQNLEDWLASVQFIIPDDAIPAIETHFKVLFDDVKVEVHIHGLVCQGLRIGSLGSAQQGESLRVHLDKVAVHCDAKVDYSSSLGLSGSADATVSTSGATAAVRLGLHSNDTTAAKIPNSASLDDCSTSLALQLAINSGTVWSQLTKHIPSLMHRLEGLVNEELQNFACDPARLSAQTLLNGFLEQVHAIAHDLISAPAPEVPEWGEKFVKLQDVPLARWIEVLDKQMQAQPGIYNNLVQKILPGGHWQAIGDSPWAMSSRTCILGGDQDADCIFHHSLHEKPAADLRVEVQFADVYANFSVIEPLEAVNASVTAFSFAEAARLRLTINTTFNGWAGGAQARGLTSLLGLDLDLADVNASGSMFLGLDRASFKRIKDFEYFPPQCLAPTFRELDVTDLACNFSIRHMELRHLNSTSISPLVLQTVALANNALLALDGYHIGMIAILNGFLRANATELGTGRLRQGAADLAAKSCPEPMGEETDGGRHPPLINPPLAYVFMGIALVLACLAGLCCIVHFLRWCRERLQPGRSNAVHLESREGKSLAKQAPWLLSVAMVLSILACIFFFVGASFLRMAETFVTLESGAGRWGEPDASVRVFQVMVYSMFFSVKKLIEDGGLSTFLAYVLVAFSGVLPYAKLAAMLLSWTLPPTPSSKRWRGRLLLVMDLIGKFSLADIFVIQFISGALHTTMRVSPTHVEGKPVAEPLSLVLRTDQEIGFLAFVLATVGSLVIGHICLHCHEKDKDDMMQNSQEDEAFSSSSRTRSLRELYKLPHVGPCLFLTLSLAAVGCTLPAFTVTLSSPLGPFSEVTYSLYSFAGKLPELAEKPNSFNTRFGQITFIFFVLISIHAHLVLLLLAWFARLKGRVLSAANVLGHMLFAYSALDVALLSMVLTLLELRASDFVALTDGQQALLGRLAGHEIHNPHGLTVGVTLGSGTWILVFAVLLHWPLGHKVTTCLERLAHARGHARLSPAPLPLTHVPAVQPLPSSATLQPQP